ncbi:PREDICTED: lymphocyte function-associated antigen 3 [Lipotes vexillifer]|uniref:Lymphocyte function-associated antigen 3 n=1 Tax=Lipotes vexillifer TaxID=118797 RepID=A0A340WUN5_LIPVE|nr:PREDICTED: lymphocyte function-associated antigen 3 [Lipotes vexillifer]
MAAGWVVGALGVVCLLLRLGEWRPPPGARGDRQRGVSVAPGLRGRVDGRGPRPLQDFISCDSQVIYGAVNKNVTLYTSSFKPFKEIVWKRGKDKVVEWDDESEVRAFLSFKDRVCLDTVSGNLTIYNLTPSDEDVYGIESPSVRNNSQFTLKVIESLPSPTLSCTLTDGNITLQCMILEDYNTHLELIQYSWDCPSTIQCQSGSKPSEAYVTKEGDLSQEIQCIISNPLFRRTTSIILSTCVPSDNTRHRFVLFTILPMLICGLLFLKSRLLERVTDSLGGGDQSQVAAVGAGALARDLRARSGDKGPFVLPAGRGRGGFGDLGRRSRGQGHGRRSRREPLGSAAGPSAAAVARSRSRASRVLLLLRCQTNLGDSGASLEPGDLAFLTCKMASYFVGRVRTE